MREKSNLESTDYEQRHGTETRYGIVGECTECGGQMVEHTLSLIDGTGYVGLLCEECNAEGRIEYEVGGENPWADPSVRAGVSETTVKSIRWVRCSDCDGDGWVLDCFDDLCHAQGRCMHDTEVVCPECHGSGNVPRVCETDGGRRKTQFWGYDTHERSVLDVVDEEEWQEQLEWALTESLAYARLVGDVKSPVGAAHFCHQPVIEHFEAMLNDLLHEPLNICTASEKIQETEQTTLVTDGGREYSPKEESLLEKDYAEPCPHCGAVVFEWWDVCRDCDAALEDENHQTKLFTDGGRDEVAHAIERQTEVLERLVEETAYQNAVLTELAQATHKVAVAQSEIAHPEEKPEHVPSLRGLRTNIQDQAFTRGEDR